MNLQGEKWNFQRMRRNVIFSENIDEWLVSLDKFDDRGVQRRVDTYYEKINLH